MIDFTIQAGRVFATKFGIPVHQQVSLAQQKPIRTVSQVDRHPLHPLLVRVRRGPRKMDTAGFELHHKQQIHRDQAALGPTLDGREIDRGQYVPMRVNTVPLPKCGLMCRSSSMGIRFC